MTTLTLGGLNTHVVGRLDEQGLVVILLHGFGAPGGDLVPLGQFIDSPPRTCFLFPEAPLEMPGFMGGRAWWLLDLEQLEADLSSGRPRDRSDQVPEGSEKPREMILALIDELKQEHGVTPERILIGGFSQGSMVATDVVLRSEHDFAGLVVWSGTLLAKDEWVPMMAKRKGLPVVQSHGESDPLLPFEIAERLRDHFRESGMIVDWVRFAGAHEIPPDVLDRTSNLIRALDKKLG